MKKTFYLFNPGRLSRQDNSLKFVAVNENGEDEKPKYLPIENISDLYVFGSLDANSTTYNFLAKNNIMVHFFDYYEHYTGSFTPKEYLLAGKLQITQAQHYLKAEDRIIIAKKFIESAAHNMLKNLKYYDNRNCTFPEKIYAIKDLAKQIPLTNEIPELMGIEGNIRQIYYSAFEQITGWTMEYRSKQPPHNAINVLISFGNMMCYTNCMDSIYHTQLNPTISFLHEPGFRRYSLALDIAEIFKPILVDRIIFKVINKKEIKEKDFVSDSNRCILKENAKKTFIRAYEDRLKETIQHRTLKKSVSYRYLIRLECYKLTKHILGIEEYKPLKMWW